MSQPAYYDSIANDPKFIEHIHKKNRMLWLLMLIFFIFYFSLLIGAAYYKPLFASIVIGQFNFGLIFAVSQYFFAAALAVFYARYMKKIDAAMLQILAAHPDK
jgi:uncharacterized membrane protein (DUF485 family)